MEISVDCDSNWSYMSVVVRERRSPHEIQVAPARNYSAARQPQNSTPEPKAQKRNSTTIWPTPRQPLSYEWWFRCRMPEG
jgi:hypothetical protein